MQISRVLMTCAATAFLSTSSLFAQTKPDPQIIGGKINWVYDYDQGCLLSKDTGKPMFVVFRCER